MKVCDPSVIYSLTIVGEELIKKQCLTINELTFYFIKARFNFMSQLAFIKDNQNCNSQYFIIILNKLQLAMSYILCK